MGVAESDDVGRADAPARCFDACFEAAHFGVDRCFLLGAEGAETFLRLCAFGVLVVGLTGVAE
ncbi:hypothetical protein HR12_23495 [Microbacterium sp. SUBG005]|nr:hypothetical protein HR12_23495 [Microbacterium sp. SUBG005]